MPRKLKRSSTTAARLAPVPDAILDHFARPGMLTGADVEAATQRFKKALIERALGAELSHHLGYPPGGAKPDDTPNHRNGTSRLLGCWPWSSGRERSPDLEAFARPGRRQRLGRRAHAERLSHSPQTPSRRQRREGCSPSKGKVRSEDASESRSSLSCEGASTYRLPCDDQSSLSCPRQSSSQRPFRQQIQLESWRAPASRPCVAEHRRPTFGQPDPPFNARRPVPVWCEGGTPDASGALH